MVEACAINFLTLVSYLTSEVIGGSTATPSARSNVSWCGLGKFSGIDGDVQF